MIVSASSELNQFARTYLNDVVVKVVRVPVAILFYGVLRFVNWRFAKFSKQEIRLNLDNYDHMYRRHVRLLETAQKIKEIPNTSIKGESFFVRLFWGQLVGATKSLLSYQRSLAQKFEQLDAPPASPPKGMKFKTSEDLVGTRVKGYEYLA